MMTDTAKPTVTLTPKAAAMVLKIRAEQGIPDDQALRMGVRGGGCSGYQYDLSFDAPRPTGDTVFTLEGVAVVVDDKSLELLNGTELDYLDGLNGSGFTFRNPNVKGTCGCGNSFC